MKRVDPKIYSKEYYLNSCLGFEEFKVHKGRKAHDRVLSFLNLIKIKEKYKVLDIGCGRGDMALECARRGATVIGIDYSKSGVSLARTTLKVQPKIIQKKVSFLVMDAKKLKFKDNSFDIITSFDVFEHLYSEELEMCMKEIRRVLKPGGSLLVHTEANKIYLDFTHRLWTFPINSLLIYINKIMTGEDYPGLPKDPRNDFHKIQHVNEPTFFYLKNLFQRHGFSGKIFSIVPYKPIISWKDKIYNVLVWFYPLSQFFPFHLLFSHDFICVETNNK